MVTSVTRLVCSQAGWSLTPGMGAGKGVPVHLVNLRGRGSINLSNVSPVKVQQPTEQLVNSCSSPDGVEEVAGDEVEPVLGGEHAHEHDSAASNVLRATLRSGCIEN